MTDRGTVDVDERTNMLIVKDLPQNIDRRPAARSRTSTSRSRRSRSKRKIVQTNHDTARQLGVQWGVNGRVSPELGNTTNLAFPNNGIALRPHDQQQGPVTQGAERPARGDTSTRPGTAVNLPATGATSRDRPLARRDQRRVQPRRRALGARAQGPGQDPVARRRSRRRTTRRRKSRRASRFRFRSSRTTR